MKINQAVKFNRQIERLVRRGITKMAKQKLTIAVDKFAGAMKTRLNKKKCQGFTGWDEGDFYHGDIPRRLGDKVTIVLCNGEECEPDDLIDIANFAMMLYRKVSA